MRTTIDVGGRELAVRVLGEGPPVLLESGLGGGIDSWPEGVLTALAGSATVVTLDRAGFGGSGRRVHATVAGMADDLVAVADHVAGPAEPFVVVGWSLGGLPAQVAAVRHRERVAGVVLIDPTPVDPPESLAVRVRWRLGGVSLRLTALASVFGAFRGERGERFARRTFGPHAPDESVELLRRFLQEPATIRTVVPTADRVSRYLREVEATLDPAPAVPLRLLLPGVRTDIPARHHGFLDRAAARLVDRWPYAGARTVDGASHQLPFERPDVVVEEIAALLPRS